ncbi:unnamed protein product [Arctogadus glacialis]
MEGLVRLIQPGDQNCLLPNRAQVGSQQGGGLTTNGEGIDGHLERDERGEGEGRGVNRGEKVIVNSYRWLWTCLHQEVLSEGRERER